MNVPITKAISTTGSISLVDLKWYKTVLAYENKVSTLTIFTDDDCMLQSFHSIYRWLLGVQLKQHIMQYI